MTEFIRPFGPSIYHGKMEPNEIELLQKIAKQTLKIRQNVGYTLVGNIHDQLGIAIEDEDEQVKFMDILHPHVYAFAKHEGERQQYLLAKQGFDYIAGEYPPATGFRFDLGRGPWINFQKAGEFNPIHSHSGLISAVVYIDVPEIILQERHNQKIETSSRCPGYIEFMYGPDVVGSNGTFMHEPQTGDFLLFNAGVKHTVYPFSSDATRISMSFNVVHYNNENEGDNNAIKNI